MKIIRYLISLFKGYNYENKLIKNMEEYDRMNKK